VALVVQVDLQDLAMQQQAVQVMLVEHQALEAVAVAVVAKKHVMVVTETVLLALVEMVVQDVYWFMLHKEKDKKTWQK
jgi:hypothetical protein